MDPKSALRSVLPEICPVSTTNTTYKICLCISLPNRVLLVELHSRDETVRISRVAAVTPAADVCGQSTPVTPVPQYLGDTVGLRDSGTDDILPRDFFLVNSTRRRED